MQHAPQKARRLRNDRDQGGNGVIDGVANVTRAAVDLLDGRRQLFEEQHGALGGDDRFLLCHRLDFSKRFFNTLDSRIRLPAEGLAAEAGGEVPFARCGRAVTVLSWLIRHFSGREIPVTIPLLN